MIFNGPDGYNQGQLKSLVGLRVQIREILGRVKASQNQPERNKHSILEGMAREQPASDLTKLVRKVFRVDR